MAALYLDENVALELAALLRAKGHAVATTVEERRLGAPDPHQLLHAVARNWTFVTHNRHDFRLLHTAWHLWSNEWGSAHPHAGILVLEQMRWRSLADLAQVIHDFVSEREEELAGMLFD
jgi:hypothetical protein